MILGGEAESLIKHETKKVCQKIERNTKQNVGEFMENHKVGMDVIQDWLAKQNLTSSLGLTIGGGAGHSTINLGGNIVFDTKGNIVIQGEFSIGATTSPVGWSGGITDSFTNAPDYSKLNGQGMNFGVSGLVPIPNCPAVGLGAGGDILAIP